MATKSIKLVPPLRNPMFEAGPDGTQRLTRVWYIFFEKLAEISATGAGGPYIRTLLLKDTTVGNDIADHVPIFQAGAVIRVIGVLRKAVTSDLTVRVNLDGSNLVTMTIPHSTAVDNPVVTEAPTPHDVADLAVLSWDVLASDGSTDADGIASFTVAWQ